MTDKEEARKEYEISFLSKSEDVAAEAAQLVRLNGGEIMAEGPVEKIALAYPIDKEAAAYFGYLHFAAEPAALPPLQAALRTNPKIMRSLIITPPFLKPKIQSVGRPKDRPIAGGEIGPVETKTRPPEPLPLSNEALEKKIEEILNQ